MVRIGIIGLSVHSEAYTSIINSANGPGDLEGCKVVALYEPPVSQDVRFSPQQIEKFSETIRKHGVKIVDSMESLLKISDAVMVLSNDGRPHLRETLPALKRKIPVYIDKPLADNFEGVQAIFKASKDWNVPVFSCSPLRFGEDFQTGIRTGKFGSILGGETYGPAPLQEAHVDLFWDGIHGVELLYTIMGSGCQTVQQLKSGDEDVVIGTWRDGRIGIFRGIRKGKAGFGGRAFGTAGVAHMDRFGGYKPLVVEIVKFFKTGISPVEDEETIEIYAFMEAARRSQMMGGGKFDIHEVLDTCCEACEPTYGEQETTKNKH